MNKEEEINRIHAEFISKLERHYGRFDPLSNKFESTSNSKIARDLFYSDSQFSRLVNNTASEGELTRALRNVQRLLDVHDLRDNAAKLGSRPNGGGPDRNIFIWLSVLLALALAVALYFLAKPSQGETKDDVQPEQTRYDMLKWGFENNYIKPYVRLKELPEDCYYPCYKYQGKWDLK